jgi:hypothetical protein
MFTEDGRFDIPDFGPTEERGADLALRQSL